LARYNSDQDIVGFLICRGDLWPERHGAIAIGGVLMVCNLEPKFFGGNGGYCVYHILQGQLPSSVYHYLELI
jgi:hypothetical protein